jgi:hypothetical protein
VQGRAKKGTEGRIQLLRGRSEAGAPRVRHSGIDDVTLAPLFTADLLKYGIERSQLIDTPKSTYPQTRAWPPAIHDEATSPEGMIWVSKRYDEERAIMLFGSRVAATNLRDAVSVDVATDPTCLAILQQISDRTGICIIRRSALL